MEDILLGSHIGMNGPSYFEETCKKALEWGENTFMVYTGAPQNSNRTPLNQCKINEGLEILKNKIDITKVIVHAPYIINLANTIDEDKFKYGVDVLINELKRTFAFGTKILVLHPGSAVGGNNKEGLDKIVEGLDIALSSDNTDVIVALETMAGKGHETCFNFADLTYIISKCKYSNRLGVCLDTCHINDAGYDLNNVDAIIDSFNKEIGLDRLKVIHLNDSKNPISSHKDRHENIGFGTIGFENLLKFVYHPKLKNVPKILETPYVNELPPYKLEIEMINVEIGEFTNDGIKAKITLKIIIFLSSSFISNFHFLLIQQTKSV